MSQYQRYYCPGGQYFFTVVTYQRQPLFEKPMHIELLKQSMRKVQRQYPFKIDALVILPFHLHCLWKIPHHDSDFSSRWRLIKHYFSREMDVFRNHRDEKLVWQRRFWEHLIRDEQDWRNHMDYIHYNPVKHRHAKSPHEWPYSSFQKWVKRGLYDLNWGASI